MSQPASRAVQLGLLRIAPVGTLFPGRAGGVGTPVIADVRGALSQVQLRRLIVNGLVGALLNTFPDADIIAGIAKAGVPWAALLAWRTRKPAAVVNLDGPRASGLQRQVEGEVDGRRVVLVDNLIRSGASLEAAANVVTAAGGQVVGALTVVGNPGVRLGFPILSLWSLRELLESSYAAGQIDEATFSNLTSEEKTK